MQRGNNIYKWINKKILKSISSGIGALSEMFPHFMVKKTCSLIVFLSGKCSSWLAFSWIGLYQPGELGSERTKGVRSRFNEWKPRSRCYFDVAIANVITSRSAEGRGSAVRLRQLQAAQWALYSYSRCPHVTCLRARLPLAYTALFASAARTAFTAVYPQQPNVK